jgi:6-pyruvoyltetrahydropterin/6-carboxytetrahydropterin synthase
MLTCTKIWREIPFAHRQADHEGHCAQIHGHDWTFEITFGAAQVDGCDFVVDFGKLKPVGEFLNKFDHACVLAQGDPLIPEIEDNTPTLRKAFNLVIVPSVSSEGLARYVYDHVDNLVRGLTGGRAYVISVQVHEGTRNSATYKRD